jgi:DNA-binding transcriptional ArsR family regulator
MFRDMRNSDISETKRLDRSPPTKAALLHTLESQLSERLPATWDASVTPLEGPGVPMADGVVTISAPDGTTGRLLIQAKAASQGDFTSLLQTLKALRAAFPTGERWLVVAPYLSTMVRKQLIEEGLGYADVTGNLRILLDRPAVFVERQGAATNPWRDDQPLQSLKGRGAGRAVRALCDFRPPYGIRELAERAGVPAPTLSRVVDLLEREGLVTRDDIGGIAEVRWSDVLRRWTQEYGLTTSNTVQTYLEPRGIDALLNKLSAGRWFDYAVTGSLAALRVAPLAPPRLAVVYVSNIEGAAKELGLRQTERGANVLLAEPFDRVVLIRYSRSEGNPLIYAAFSQVAADLLTSPGRGPEEAEALLTWMETHEDAWRL